MSDAERLEYMMKCLKEDFGITSKEQFYEEFSRMSPLDISVFTAPCPNTANTDKKVIL